MANTNPIRDWQFSPLKYTKYRYDLSGQRFGRLWCMGVVGTRRTSKDRHVYWICICDCDEVVFISTTALIRTGTRSCGCLRRDIQPAFKHGGKYTSTYKTWTSMNNRCCNINGDDYLLYGGRGITICDQWRGPDGFKNFLNDMGHKPDGRSLDRIDVNGNYSPENCRWASPTQQGRNKRNNRMITYQGITLTQVEWAERAGLKDDTFGSRIRAGWSIERAMNTPVL